MLSAHSRSFVRSRRISRASSQPRFQPRSSPRVELRQNQVALPATHSRATYRASTADRNDTVARVVAKQIPEPDKEAAFPYSAGPGKPPRSREVTQCEACSGLLDLRSYARCDVCEERLLCLPCARSHVCTPQCPERGCLPSLCVRVIRDGQVSEHFGVEAA